MRSELAYQVFASSLGPEDEEQPANVRLGLHVHAPLIRQATYHGANVGSIGIAPGETDATVGSEKFRHGHDDGLS